MTPLVHWLRALEDALLIVAFGSLVVLAGLQIVMRNIFESGFVWIDPLLRILVLWVGMLGALAATRDNRHINIDIFSRLLPERFQPFARRVIALASAIVCGLLAWHTFRFVRDEYAFSDYAVAGVPVWFWQAILPFGFTLMSLRFAIAVFIQRREAAE